VELLDYQPKINTTGGKVIEDLEKEDTQRNDENEVQIALENIRFEYPTKKDVEVLKGISINVTKNKVVALVGASGKKMKLRISV
jgi:ABC-type bacteriocin/lantibiotic exporter with double-glycine peptidase domain